MTPIGIDLGSRSVRLIQLRRRGARHEVVAAAMRDLPAEAESGQAVADAIADALHDGGFRGRRAISCLPASAIQYKNLRVPKMPADELRQAVHWEAAERLQLHDDDHHLQFFNAGEVRQGEDVRQEIILLAAPRQQVSDHLDLLLRCRLEPVAIEAVPSALARCFGPRDDDTDADGQIRVVLDVGYSSTKVLILRHGLVMFFKLIDIGGRHLDENLSQHLGLPVAEVAALRRRLGQDEPGPGEPDPPLFGGARRESVERAIHESIRKVVEDLAREVGLCLRYVSVTFRGRRPEAVSMVGGESKQPRLAEALAETAGVRVEPAEPLPGIDADDELGLGPGPGIGGEWAVAAGLALRAASQRGRRAA